MPSNDTVQNPPRVHLAIVSPCSTCKNHREEPEGNKPACPRRALLKLARDREKDGKPLSPSFSPALLTGTEGTDQQGSDALANPVYSDDQHHILVWAAHLEDNMGVYEKSGELVSPPLWSQGQMEDFNTEYLHCNNLPYVVRETEASYFQQGAYKEWDTLECLETRSPQLLGSAPGTVTDFDPIKVEGFAKKVNLAFGFPRQPVEQDLHPRGT